MKVQEVTIVKFTTFINNSAEVAQLVEHTTENRGVGGPSPPLGTNLGEPK